MHMAGFLRLTADRYAGAKSMHSGKFGDKVETFGRYMYGLSLASGIPAAEHLDLMEVHALASNIMILDVDNDGDRHQVRFFGTALVQYFSGEWTGKAVDQIDFGTHTDAILDAHSVTLDTRMPVWTRAAEPVPHDDPLLALDGHGLVYERLVWPLATEGGRIVQLVEIVLRESVAEVVESFSSRIVVPTDFN